MAADGRVIIDTLLDDKGAIIGMKSLEGTLTKMASKIGAILASAFAIDKLISFKDEVIELYNIQITSETKLATIMRKRMNATRDDIKSIKELASAQQALGVIGDEVQLAGVQQMATFLTSKKSIEKLLPAMNNLIAQQEGVNATVGGAVSVGNLIGKVMQGSTAALTRVGITFSEAEEKALKFGNEEQRAAILAKIINNNVGEMNKALANTNMGRQQQLANTVGDVKEKFGQAAQSILVLFIPALEKLAKFADIVADKFIILANAISKAFNMSNKTETAETSANIGNIVGDTNDIISDNTDIVDDNTDALKEQDKQLNKSLRSWDELNNIQSEDKAEDAAGEIYDSLSSLGDIDTTPFGEAYDNLEPSDEFIENIRKKLEELKDIFQPLKDMIEYMRNGDYASAGDSFSQFFINVFDAIRRAIDSINWHDLGQSISEFFNGIDWYNLTVSFGNLLYSALNAGLDFVIGLFDGNPTGELFVTKIIEGIIYWLDNSDWETIGNKIGTILVDLFEKTDWIGLFKAIGRLIWSALNAGIKLWKGSFDVAPFETVILTAFALLKFTGLGKLLIGKLLPIIDTSLKTVLEGGFAKLVGLINSAGNFIATMWDKLLYVPTHASTVGLSVAELFGGIISVITGAVTAVVAFVKEWKEGWQPVIDIIKTIGVVLAAIGAILLGAPAFIAAVVAGIVLIISELVIYMKENWDDVKEYWNNTWTSISDFFKSQWEDISDFWSTAWNDFVNNIKIGIDEAKEFWSEMWEHFSANTQSQWEDISGFWSELWNNLTTKMSESGENIKSGFSKIWENIKSIANKAANGLIRVVNFILKSVTDGINSVIEMLNRVKIDIPEFLGGGTIGFNIGKINGYQIPYLATGAVIPANSPFMAVLGDQKSGTNIEAPLDTIKQALNEVMQGYNGGNGDIVVQIDGREIFRAVRNQNEDYKRMTGKGAFA